MADAVLATPRRAAASVPATTLDTTPDSDRVRRHLAREADDPMPTQMQDSLRVQGDASGAQVNVLESCCPVVCLCVCIKVFFCEFSYGCNSYVLSLRGFLYKVIVTRVLTAPGREDFQQTDFRRGPYGSGPRRHACSVWPKLVQGWRWLHDTDILETLVSVLRTGTAGRMRSGL